MKKLKKLSRNDLKVINGGNAAPADMCSPGSGYCEQFGLECGIYMTRTWSAWRCI